MIEVLKPGFYTLIQDAGRFAYQEFGMPISGVLDMDSYRLANWLVGNRTGEAVLEIVIQGPKLQFKKDTFIALTGADVSPKVDGYTISMYKTIRILKGSVLSFGELKNGYRCYLSINGGLTIENEMGSRSTYTYAAIGGLKGRELRKNDVLKLAVQKRLKIRDIPIEFRTRQFSTMSVRVMEGPEFELLPICDREVLFNQEFTLGHNSNRMGCRLEGTPLNAIKKEIISSGAVNGTIQLPANGNPIVLLAEAQTTGGYPRIAIIIKADLPLLAQQKPGDKIRFRKVSLEQAQAIGFNKEKRFQELLK